jgi:5-methylcytosine-specific restriction protein B
MARVRELFKEDGPGRPHPTEVECGWRVIRGVDGAHVLQLSTYGSDDRQSEKKVSQTLQIDRVIAAELATLLRETFDL